MISSRTLYGLLYKASWLMVILTGVHLGHRYFTRTEDILYLRALQQYLSGCYYAVPSTETFVVQEDIVDKALDYLLSEDFVYDQEAAAAWSPQAQGTNPKQKEHEALTTVWGIEEPTSVPGRRRRKRMRRR
jgi:hypothetical protein